ncbi:MAG: hypothetical protein GWO24_22860, partial [Akkermansiaceae bacterium]|nr:hypothetical protein [Akkermansiaceae bacterium]
MVEKCEVRCAADSPGARDSNRSSFGIVEEQQQVLGGGGIAGKFTHPEGFLEFVGARVFAHRTEMRDATLFGFGDPQEPRQARRGRHPFLDDVAKIPPAG